MILKNFANCNQSHLCTQLCLSSLFISLFMKLNYNSKNNIASMGQFPHLSENNIYSHPQMKNLRQKHTGINSVLGSQIQSMTTFDVYMSQWA